METVPSALQFGALGLLAIVLVGIGKFLFDLVKENADHSRRLGDRAIDSLEKVVENNTEERVQAREAMAELLREFKNHDTRSSDERKEIKTSIENLSAK